MQPGPHRGLSSYQLKWIAIVAMFGDHLANVYFSVTTPTGVIIHTIGRLTAPIMCFFLAEGFYYTGNVNRYAARLGIFAAISLLPYNFFCIAYTGTCRFYDFGVIYTLFLALLTLIVWHCDTIQPIWKTVLICGLLVASYWGDWQWWAILWALNFSLFRDKPIIKWLIYLGLCLVEILSRLLYWYHVQPDLLPYMLYHCGVLLAIPLLLRYNGQLGGGHRKSSKWFFYLFYPIHLTLLGILALLCPNI